MNIDFGVVKIYFPDKGYGFVTHTFSSEHKSEFFFHIKNIKRTRRDLADRLENEEPFGTIYFWYEIEETIRGDQVRDQVRNVLERDAIHELVSDNLPSFVHKIESKWTDIDSSIPVWLLEVTVDLVGSERASELSAKRETLIKERREVEEKKREEWETLIKERRAVEEKEREERERLRKIEKAEREKREETNEAEFEQLVAEIEPLGFTRSNQVSQYIIDHQLGLKYKNISGIVTMADDYATWDFPGGFPPAIYRRLCERLGLSNQGTNARAVAFKPFKDLG